MWILCLAEDSLETSSLIFSEKKNTMKKQLWMSSAAVVIGALKVKALFHVMAQLWLKLMMDVRML